MKSMFAELFRQPFSIRFTLENFRKIRLNTAVEGGFADRFKITFEVSLWAARISCLGVHNRHKVQHGSRRDISVANSIYLVQIAVECFWGIFGKWH
nr:hypothetical protein [Roseobacter litoralis]